MRSVSSLIILGAVTVPLAGCVTTQERNNWAKLRADRVIAGRTPSLVTVPNPDVAVGSVRAVRTKRTVAIVVDLRNTSSRAVTDLPITVGVRRGGRGSAKPSYLNRRSGRDYFLNHVASLAPGAAQSWVFRTSKVDAARGELFATVGTPAQPPLSTASALPRIAVEQTGRTAAAVTVRARNETQIPQYGLQLYAVARRGGQTVAAGRTSVDTLYPNGRADATIRLVGRSQGATVTVAAVPTIFK